VIRVSRVRHPAAAIAGGLLLAMTVPHASATQSAHLGITAVDGVRVGHFTRGDRPTGCTVILLPDGSVGGVDVRGGAPGTAETDVLAPDNMVQIVNAIVLSGGSAYGLDARQGVMTYLNEHKIGFPIGGGVVPIVPAAILFDLGVGGSFNIWPDASCGYQAASTATGGAVPEGSIGAGAGATVGKLAGAARAMKGGIGTSAIRGADGLIVGAIVAVNAVGTVFDRHTGRPVAGIRTADGKGLEDPWTFAARPTLAGPAPLQNTTIGVVATNARLTKAQALRISEMAHDGIARAIVPSHTQADGDTLFAIGTGALDREADVSTIGRLAAEAVSDAILRGVTTAKGLPGFPAASEIK
jgi:L-aminopeptidase/D-esterase-like protein